MMVRDSPEHMHVFIAFLLPFCRIMLMGFAVTYVRCCIPYLLSDVQTRCFAILFLLFCLLRFWWLSIYRSSCRASWPRSHRQKGDPVMATITAACSFGFAFVLSSSPPLFLVGTVLRFWLRRAGNRDLTDLTDLPEPSSLVIHRPPCMWACVEYVFDSEQS